MNISKSQPFSQLLTGEQAFFNQDDYFDKTKKEMSQVERLPVTYTCNTDKWKKKVNLIEGAKLFFSNVAFPMPFYKTLQGIATEFVLPSSGVAVKVNRQYEVERCKGLHEFWWNWKSKRLTIAVDGHEIDVVIMVEPRYLEKKRWVLYSPGNTDFYEHTLVNDSLKNFLKATQANLITFNYPGVLGSSGIPNKTTMEKAYRAVLTFLEDDEYGIGAKQIFGLGHSIGGGVQGEALKKHKLKDGVKYVFIKIQTFSSIKQLVSLNYNKFLGSLITTLNLNLDSVKSSKSLKVPEIIVQTADVAEATVLKTKDDLRRSPFKDDGVIPLNSILANALLTDSGDPLPNKQFLAIPENHQDDLSEATQKKLVELIFKALEEPVPIEEEYLDDSTDIE